MSEISANFGAVEPDLESFQRARKLWRGSQPGDGVTIFRELASRGSALSTMQIAKAYQYGRGVTPDLTEAEAWYKRAAEMGSCEAQTSFGIWLSFRDCNKLTVTVKTK